MTAYRVASPLQHDGIAHAPGDAVEAALFTPAQLAWLTATGTLQPDSRQSDPPAAAPAAASAGEGASPPPSPAPPSPADEPPLAKKGARK